MRREVYIHIKQPTSCSAWRKRNSKTSWETTLHLYVLYRLSWRVVSTITTPPRSTTIILMFNISHNNQSVGERFHQPTNQPVHINKKWSFRTPQHWSSYFTLCLSTLSLQKWYTTKNVNYTSQRHKHCTMTRWLVWWLLCTSVNYIS